MITPQPLSALTPHLSPDGVSDGGDELAPEAELRAQPARELLRRVLLLRQVPLELVHEGDVAQVDVQLDHHALVGLGAQQVVLRTRN